MQDHVNPIHGANPLTSATFHQISSTEPAGSIQRSQDQTPTRKWIPLKTGHIIIIPNMISLLPKELEYAQFKINLEDLFQKLRDASLFTRTI